MKSKSKVIYREDKDGILKIVTEVRECQTYQVVEYLDRKTGHYSSITFDEEGEIVDGHGGGLPDIVISELENKEKKKTTM